MNVPSGGQREVTSPLGHRDRVEKNCMKRNLKFDNRRDIRVERLLRNFSILRYLLGRNKIMLPALLERLKDVKSVFVLKGTSDK